MARRVASVLAVLAVLAGGASAAPTKKGDPQKRHNPADQARAGSLRIQRGDLGAGDWRVERAGNNEPLAGCEDPDMSDLVETGKAENPNFSRNGSYVGSVGEVWATSHDGVVSWNRSLKFPWRSCLARELKRSLGSDPRLKLTIMSSGSIATSKLTPRAFGYGLRFRVKGPAAAIDGRMALYAYGKGRVDSSLLVLSIGKPLQPIPLALERRLAAAVARRVNR